MAQKKALLLVALWLLLAGGASYGQTATATISGIVSDETDNVIPGVRVMVKNLATGAARGATTDGDGRYSLTNLEPGEYELRAEHRGFKTAVQSGVVLTVGGSAVSNITMRVGAVTEEVMVNTEESLIEPSKIEVSRVVAAQEIESLPNIGRNFVDFVKLSSGVAPGRENIGGGAFKEPDTGVGSSAAPRLTFGGQQELSTLIQVDGADNIQTFTGLPRATPSQEAVREFRVLNSTYLAEYGRALGGFVNIVTKSGTNQLRGSLYYFGMNDALNARPLLTGPDPVLRQNQYGATIGGPIKKNEIFFFGAYEGQRRAESNKFSQVILSNLDAINLVRKRFGLRPEVSDLVRSSDYDQFLLKLDYQFANSHSFSFRYNFLDADTRNFPGGGGRASPASSTARNNFTRDQAFVFNGISVISAAMVNEARVQWAKRTFVFPSVLGEPSLEITNLIIMGKSTSDTDFYQERRIQLADNLSYGAGGHQVKGGFDLNQIEDHSRLDLFFPARIIFPNLTAFLNVTPTVFWWPFLRTASAHPGFSLPFERAVPRAWENANFFNLTHSSYGFYAQDQWKVTPRVTLNAGLRYDFEFYPARYQTERDFNNLQPRLGLAFAYSNKGVVRAGYGLFHDRIASSVGQVYNAIEWSSRADLPNAVLLFPDLARVFGRYDQLTQGGALATPATITFLTTGQPPATRVAPPGLANNVNGKLKNPYSQQASLQISHEVGGGVAVAASYLLVRGLKIIAHTPNINAVQTGNLPTGKPSYTGPAGRRFPELGPFFVTDNVGASTYHGGTLEVEKRFSRGVSFHGAYTFSKTISNSDSVANLADLPEGQELRLERALSRQHVAHRFVLSALAAVPKSVAVIRHFKFGAILSVESGRRFNVFAGGDFNGDGNPNSDRPGLLGRNTLAGPGFASFDLRVSRELAESKRLRAELSLDFFNLFNRVNVKDLNTLYGGFDLNVTPNPLLGFRTPRDAFNPRQIQFGIKLKF